MKIQSSTVSAADQLTYGRTGRAERGERGVSSGTAAGASGRAAEIHSSAVVAGMHASSKYHPFGEVRAHKVAEAKADIAMGRLGGAADMERTIDALMRGF